MATAAEINKPEVVYTFKINGVENELYLGTSKKDGKEYFIPKRHVRFRCPDSILGKIGKKYLDNPYVEDYRSFLQSNVKDVNPIENASPVEFHITKVNHCTNLDRVKGILGEQLFRGSLEQFGEQEIKLSWWGIKISSDEATEGKKKIYRNMKNYLDRVYSHNLFPENLEEINGMMESKEKERMKELLSQYTSSPVFKEGSNYGNFKFTYGLNDIIEAYKTEYRCRDVEFRALGTYFHKMQVLHTVVVYPSDNTQEIFHGCSQLDVDDWEYPAYMFHEDQVWNLSWRPDSTGSDTREMGKNPIKPDGSWNKELNYGNRHWDNMALVFYIPKGSEGFEVQGDIVSHVSACEDIRHWIKVKNKMPVEEAEEKLKKIIQEKSLIEGVENISLGKQ